MSDNESCKVEICTGGPSTRRAVAFLYYRESRYVNAGERFKKFRDDVQRLFRRRFDNWIAGHINKKHYHGWNQSQYGGRYTGCFVFKAGKDRLYGFLCHLKLELDRGNDLCVLVTHRKKHEWRTERTALRQCEIMRLKQVVCDAIASRFRENNEV